MKKNKLGLTDLDVKILLKEIKSAIKRIRKNNKREKND